MAGWKHKYQMYKHLQLSTPKIYAELKDAAAGIGLTDDLKGNIGATGAVSNCHGLISDRVSAAVEAGNRKVMDSAVLDERIRELVKDYYGDEWDGACVNTCEAGLWVTLDTLFSPPFTGRGGNYRARYIAPYERHLHHQGGYGRPFPPRYKDLFADRGTTAGELGFSGKRMADMDVIYARLSGASYACHGIKYHPTPLLSKVDAKESVKSMARIADRHADSVSGFVSLGYDTVGYGYGQKNSSGTPELQLGIAGLAREFGVPYVVDNAWGIPLLGTDPRKIGADVMIFSMDKASGAPTAGLIVGREEPMVAIRRALGIHGSRWGTVSSHGKAAYVTNDPGKEALLGVIAALEVIHEQPDFIAGELNKLHNIVLDCLAKQPREIREGCVVSKSVNSQAIEINYEPSWANGGLGMPIFSIEDMYSGSHLLQTGMAQMGIVPTIAYDANIFISSGLGTTDRDGRLMEDRARLVALGAFKVLEVVSRHAGFLSSDAARAAA